MLLTINVVILVKQLAWKTDGVWDMKSHDTEKKKTLSFIF